MKRVEFIKPFLEVNKNEAQLGANSAVITVSRLERGYGITLGNSLRRVMLSSMPGFAFVACEVPGVKDDYSVIDGIEETLIDIILNLKGVVLKCTDEALLASTESFSKAELLIVKCRIKTSGIVTAGDLEYPAGLEPVNPEAYLAKVKRGGELVADFFVNRGLGYKSKAENAEYCEPSWFAMSSEYTPIKRCRYEVEKKREGDDVSYEKLILKVTTDGSIAPDDAVHLASQQLIDELEVATSLNPQIANTNYIYELEEKTINKKLQKKIESIDLNQRAYNCLKRSGVETVGDLTNLTEDRLWQLPNMGKKTIDQIKQKLAEEGLELRSSAVEEVIIIDRDVQIDDE